MNKTLFEDYEFPDIAGGYILAEQAKRATQIRCKTYAGDQFSIRENFRLLTTGDVS